MKIELLSGVSNQFSDYYEDKVFLENRHYKIIFGKSYKEAGYSPWKRGIVKIKYNGNTIRRLFHSGNNLNIKEDSIGLSIISMQILEIQADEIYDLSLRRGNRFMFMWQHPNHLIRIGFKYTIILGSLSIAISLIPLLKKMVILIFG